MDKFKKAKRLIWRTLKKDQELKELFVVLIVDVLVREVGRLEDGGWERIAGKILERILT
jgi:hypothetical protein